MNGVLLIDKPKEHTSFDVVAIVRRLISQKKIGHTGTLDPNATGVLPILIGNATKAQDIIPNHDKEYIAGFQLGITSDTLDIWGEIKENSAPSVKRAELEKALESFRGEIDQIPPMYSAVQIKGQRLYDLARQGIEVERKPRRVTIYELVLLNYDEDKSGGTLKIYCSKGTYIRSLIDDIGKLLGTGAVMTSLDRTRACGFNKKDCIPLEKLRALSPAEIELSLSSTESLFLNYPELDVSKAQAKRFSNGGALDINRTSLRNKSVTEGKIFRIKNSETFYGLGTVKDNLIKIYKHF